jgi:hypothetical protein
MKPGVDDADLAVDDVHQNGVVAVLNDNTVRAFDDRFLYYIGKHTSPNERPGLAVKYDSNELLQVSYMLIAETPGEDWIAFLGQPDRALFITIIIQASWSEPLPSVGHATVRPLDKDQIKSLFRERFGG